MTIEGVVDGIELDSGFLDDLFLAIRDKLPSGKWIPISKDHDRVVAGLKYLIDCNMFSADFYVSLNQDFTHFRKIDDLKRKPHPFDGKQTSNHGYAYWAAQDALILENRKKEMLKSRRLDELEQHREKKRKRR
jgi:hypothetical protein